MEFINENLPKLIVLTVILVFVGAALRSYWPKRCAVCGKRAVRRRKPHCCSGCSCENEGILVCDLCHATFKDDAELKAKTAARADSG